MTSEPARLGEISIDFSRIPPRWNEYFSYEHAWVGQPGKVGHVYISFWNSFQIRFQHGYYEYHHDRSQKNNKRQLS